MNAYTVLWKPDRLAAILGAHYVAGGLYEKDPSTAATKKKYYRFGGRLVAEREVPSDGGAGTLHSLHQDHLGSTTLQTSATGSYEGHQFRGPYGQPWYASGSLSTDLRYTGQRSLEQAQGAQPGLGSLLHYQARWYSPVLGRFLQPDTIVPDPAKGQDFNRYTYVRNNPLRLTDPSGNAPIGPNQTAPTGSRYGGQKVEDNGAIMHGEYRHESWGIQFIPTPDSSHSAPFLNGGINPAGI